MSNKVMYSMEFKEQLVKEAKETKSIRAVARRHNVSDSVLRSWIRKSGGSLIRKVSINSLQKELDKKDLEIQILKELLKKTNQAWLAE